MKKKNRLFVFGDSWANNYFSKKNDLVKCKPFLGLGEVESYAKYHDYFGHWIDHISNYYEVYSYGVGAATNEQIIFQLANLPEYKKGDRMIMIFTTPHRFNWFFNKRKYSILPHGSSTKNLFSGDEKILNFIENQFVEKYNWWSDEKIDKDEIKLINKIPILYKQWNPIMVTWTSDFSNFVTSVELIDFANYKLTNIFEESEEFIRDNHLGAIGNFELFKYFAKKLDLDISDYSFIPKVFKKTIL